MSRKRISSEANIYKLSGAEILTSKGQTVREAAKGICVTEQTYYHWREADGDMVPSQAQRLKVLERENAAEEANGGSIP